jgi:hypothetical protein
MKINLVSRKILCIFAETLKRSDMKKLGIIVILWLATLLVLLAGCTSTTQVCSWDRNQFSNHYQTRR